MTEDFGGEMGRLLESSACAMSCGCIMMCLLL